MWQCADYARHFISVVAENCGYYGKGNSQNIAPVGDLCVVGNTCACLINYLL